MMGSMAAGNLVPVFANMDFWTQVVEQHPEFFARVGRLQEAVRSIVDPAYEGLDGGQQMHMNMLMLTAIGVAEIVTLVGNGMGHGAMKIVRGVMENAINMEYMRQIPDQAEKYLEWQWVEQHKLHKHLEESSPALHAEIPQEKRDSDEAEYRRVRPLFQYQVQTRTGGAKTKMQDGWCREDLFHRAERVGLAQSYRTVMPSANQILHGTISGWIRDLDEVTRRIEYPPTHKWGGEALIAAHMALVQAIETASLALNATPTPSLETLKEDFQAAWGENPPKISEAAVHAEIASEPIEDDEDGEESE
ncbi:MAG: DUF5677 domain-containing protein [Terracidiphilus sp.]